MKIENTHLFVSQYDVEQLKEIANKCSKAVAVWALAQCAPWMTGKETVDFISDLLSDMRYRTDM